ncbi:GntP family permease [Sessilibacter corallicola]|uniref:GntP family permease n=1 Tax=Sessilibacter corallicola TaxID=2904075 RepID=A0ABQ0A910_9GAMM
MEYLGILSSVVLLIWLALRGVNIIFASILCSLVVIVTNGLPIGQALSDYYTFGPLGAFTFAGKFFILFMAGAIFGKVMGESHAAASIALALIRRLGSHRALLITTLACALLTYGGVVVFVVIFAMYPLGLKLLQEANIPKRLFAGAIALGAGTFTLTALPGTPSIHNVISATALGTDLFAGFWEGIAGGALMLIAGLWYLERERKIAIARGEGFVPGPNDKITNPDNHDYPHWVLSSIPLIIVLSCIIAPRILSGLTIFEGENLPSILKFAISQPIIWPSLSLLIGSVAAVIIFSNIRRNTLKVMGEGTHDSIFPLINTAAVIGFGGVVSHTEGFAQFSAWILNVDMPPLLSMFVSVSLASAITGSSSGGLQIFMQTMAPRYLEMGIDVETLHRITTMASGGFDSLPHCGAIVATLAITGMTHKEAYKDVGIITVVIPVITTLLLIFAIS